VRMFPSCRSTRVRGGILGGGDGQFLGKLQWLKMTSRVLQYLQEMYNLVGGRVWIFRKKKRRICSRSHWGGRAISWKRGKGNKKWCGLRVSAKQDFNDY